MGGSQGAHAINLAMTQAAPTLAAAGAPLAITHQTGERDLAVVRQAYEAAGLAARVEPFLYEMDREMKRADVVVARAGATTLSELAAAGRPAILVPLPTAADDHQRRNAEAFARIGGAVVLEERGLTGERLAAEVLTLARDRVRREDMAPAVADAGAARCGRTDRRQRCTRLLGKTRRIHFVGVGGIGMSGIAELLANLGYAVSGSDARQSDVTDRLESLGVTVHVGHRGGQRRRRGRRGVFVGRQGRQPRARRRPASGGMPVIPRAEMLAELMRLRFGIAVAGAHGKTSTTSMIALVLERAGLDPTAVIGGRLSAFGSNARLGRGEYMVVEADESDRSFLKLSPSMAVMTNIDREHMEAYGSFADLQQAFVDFANKVPFYGAVVACADDAELGAVSPRFTRRVITYGIEAPDAEVRATEVVLEGFGARCVVHRRNPSGDGHAAALGPLTLQVPGRHSVLNALAAVAVGLELDVPFARHRPGPRGVPRRRAPLRARRRRRTASPWSTTTVITPRRSPRCWRPPAPPGRRVVVVAFQPHRYYADGAICWTEFGRALAAADEVVLTDIYAASEDPIPGVTRRGAGRGRQRGIAPRPSTSCRTARRAAGGRGPIWPGPATWC